MNGKFLLDTNIIIALFIGDASVQKNLAEAGKVFIPAVVLGELYYGARKSGQVAFKYHYITQITIIHGQIIPNIKYGNIILAPVLTSGMALLIV